MRYNDIIFNKKEFSFYTFIIYREDKNIYLVERIKRTIGYYSWNRYEDISEEKFKELFITKKYDAINYIEDIKKKQLKTFEVPEKLLKKRENLEWQLNCMINHNKPIEHIKSWERAIKRVNKKIQNKEEIFIKEQKNIMDYYDNIIKLVNENMK